jgi:hypothetical protein
LYNEQRERAIGGEMGFIDCISESTLNQPYSPSQNELEKTNEIKQQQEASRKTNSSETNPFCFGTDCKRLNDHRVSLLVCFSFYP